MAYVDDTIRDDGLQSGTDNINKIVICSQAPATFAEANATYALGSKTSPTVSNPQDRSGGGREIEISAFTDGSVTATGTATHWAALDTVNSVLVAWGTLASSQVVTNGNTWELDAQQIGIPDAA